MNSKYYAAASEVINARAEDIHAVITDYRVAHQEILPKPPFIRLDVQEGGKGAGTVVHTHLKAWGKEVVIKQVVTEPEPGRVIVETDVETGQFSSFTLDPVNGGRQTRVTIASEFPASPGLKGIVERLLQAPAVRRVYQQELRNLEAYLQKKTAA